MADSKCGGAAAGGGAVYGIGWFGAVIYYIQAADSFWGGVWGIVKSFFWPGFLVYEVMKFLEM
jgi:hypothetical protein